MPNSQAPSRRTFLTSTAVAAVAVAGGVPLLSACSGSGTAGKGGVATGSALKKLLPSYVARTVVEADIPSKNGSTPGFTKFPAALKSSVSGKSITGSYKAYTPLWGSVPDKDNAYFKAVNKALGGTVTFDIQDGNTYIDKLGAVLAGSSIADIVCIPGWNLTGQIPDAVSAKFADLGPYLSGDKVKKYPNLAAIPTAAWQMSIFGGKLRGLPMPSSPFPNILYYRADIFEKKGYTVPKSPDEFLTWAKEATSAKAKVWACDDIWTAAQMIFSLPPDRPNYWVEKNGKLVHKVELPEYLEALEWVRKLYKAGVVHPDAVAGKTDTAKTRFSSGQTLAYNDGTSVWYGMTQEQQAANPEFKIMGMDYFGAEGGDPSLYRQSPAGIFSFINKKLSAKQIQECLAIANFTAAPYGTKEYMLTNFGVEGVHWNLKDGMPVKTDQGNKEAVSSYFFIASPESVEAHPDTPQEVKDYCAWMERMGAFFKDPMFYGMQIQEPTKYASLYTPFDDLQKDVVRGRKSIKDTQAAISDWKSSGGDQLRAWYQKLQDTSGSSAS